MMGVEVDRVVMMTFFLGSALAGAAGLIFGLYYNYTSFIIGYTAGLRAFTAAVLGGIGSIPGAMLGGILIGLIESLGGQFIAVRWTDVIIFSILVLVLVFRPTGLLGHAYPRQSPEASMLTLNSRDSSLHDTLLLRRIRQHSAAGRFSSPFRSASLLFPLIDGNEADIDAAANACAFAVLALGLNIVVGFAGLLDLGYAAFFAIGAYSYGIVASWQLQPEWSSFWEPFQWLGLVARYHVDGRPDVVHFTLSFWLALPISAMVAAFFGVLFGAPTLRLRGDYLAIVTLGFGEIVPIVARNSP